jgi:hypothetical protein
MKRLRFGLDFEKADSIRKAVASMLHHCFPTATERLFPFDRMALERASLIFKSDFSSQNAGDSSASSNVRHSTSAQWPATLITAEGVYADIERAVMAPASMVLSKVSVGTADGGWSRYSSVLKLYADLLFIDRSEFERLRGTSRWALDPQRMQFRIRCAPCAARCRGRAPWGNARRMRPWDGRV